MKKVNLSGLKDVKNLLSPTDTLAIAVVIVGILLAVFINKIEMRLIGCSIAILGIVAFFMLISQRLKTFLDAKKYNRTNVAPPALKIKQTKDTQANRKIIEDLDSSLDDDLKNVKSQSADEKKKSAASADKSPKKEPAEPPTQYSKPKASIHTEYSDGAEGFKVIGKSKTAGAVKSAPAAPKEENKNTPAAAAFVEKSAAGKGIEASFPINPPTEKSEQTHREDETPHQPKVPMPKPPQPAQPHQPKVPMPQPPQPAQQQQAEVPPMPQQIHTPQQPKVQPQQQPAQPKAAPSPAGTRPQSVTSTAPEPQQQFESAETIMTDETASTLEPRNEFAGFVSRTLMVIRSITSTKTVAFFLINSEKRNLILETFVTDVPDAVIENSKIPMGGDVISQIAINGKPEILTEISPVAELDLLPYYKYTTNSHSFIGLPVFYNGAVMGVLCADTTEEDAYDNITVGFLGHFTKILAALVINYTEKHELRQASRVLTAIEKIRDLISNGSESIDTIANAFITAGKGIFDYIELGMVSYSPDKKMWQISAYDSPVSNSKLKGIQVDLQNSIIGDVISTCNTANMPLTGQTPIRVNRGELRLSQGYFVAVPIYSIKTTYGALFLTVKTVADISEYDIDMLETLGDNLGLIIEQIYLQKEIASTSMNDPETGIMNMPAFNSALAAETARRADFNIPMVVLTLHLDPYTSLNPAEHYARYNAVLKHIIAQISGLIKPYDLFGRDENDTMFLGLSGMTLADAQLWAERLRSDVARTIITIENRKFSVTISGGIAEISKNDTAQSVVGKSMNALEVASKKTNNIQIFS